MNPQGELCLAVTSFSAQAALEIMVVCDSTFRLLVGRFAPPVCGRATKNDKLQSMNAVFRSSLNQEIIVGV
jgi:hypothetical protein